MSEMKPLHACLSVYGEFETTLSKGFKFPSNLICRICGKLATQTPARFNVRLSNATCSQNQSVLVPKIKQQQRADPLLGKQLCRRLRLDRLL